MFFLQIYKKQNKGVRKVKGQNSIPYSILSFVHLVTKLLQGKDGVVQMLCILKEEISTAMALSGKCYIFQIWIKIEIQMYIKHQDMIGVV